LCVLARICGQQNLKVNRAYLLKEGFRCFCECTCRANGEMYPDRWLWRGTDCRLEPMRNCPDDQESQGGDLELLQGTDHQGLSRGMNARPGWSAGGHMDTGRLALHLALHHLIGDTPMPETSHRFRGAIRFRTPRGKSLPDGDARLFAFRAGFNYPAVAPSRLTGVGDLHHKLISTQQKQSLTTEIVLKRHLRPIYLLHVLIEMLIDAQMNICDESLRHLAVYSPSNPGEVSLPGSTSVHSLSSLAV
jgi:hypothetical protein